MPLHKIKSGPTQDDLDVLEQAVHELEAKGEELVQVLPNWLNYPVGQVVLITRKAAGKIERRTKSA